MSLDSLVRKLQKDFKSVNVMMLDEVPKLDVISTGIPSLDYATEIGGYPRRLITEVYGPEQIGKSVLAWLAIAEAQKAGLVPAMITTEGIPDTNWASILGVDIKNVLVVFAHTVEMLVEQAKDISASEDIGLMVIDSLAAAGTAKEIAEDGKRQAYGISGNVSQMMHALIPNCWNTNKACLIMNQVRDKSVGNYVVLDSPGGHSLHHGASIRVYLKKGASPNSRVAKVDGQDVEIAKLITAIVKKNKAGAPNREATYWIYDKRPDDLTNFPGRGVDIVIPLIDVGQILEIIEAKAGQHKIEAMDYEQPWDNRGRDKFEAWLREDYTRVDQLYDLVREKLYTEGQQKEEKDGNEG